ncbi:MAG: sigma 54-interacting transcriptional regulator [Deltaproteobacteria bacterium]|nr:sigma 54-interacting transcriptional regulator [Deltaproteobacteria bacterium]
MSNRHSQFPSSNSHKTFQLSRHRDSILDSINEGVFTVDLNRRVTSFNRAAEEITGISRKDAIGQRCSEVFRANICQDACVMKTVLQNGKSAVNASVFVVNAWGESIPIRVSAAVLHDVEGKVIGGVETFQDCRQLEELRKKLSKQHSFADIIGKSEAIQRLFNILPQISNSDSTVLIHGASGTGKELVARAIHTLSPRKPNPFVAVNCGALPDTLLESELFGYKKGAFTGADRDKPGRFFMAQGGTLFLDEIGDISPAMQVRLLRVLQEKTFEPLGAVNSEQTDARIITATNKDLRALVRKGLFREDLYYRIHVIQIDVPPLNDRREDIPLLVDHFISSYNMIQDGQITGISKDALSILMQHDFPGNVRELQNIIEHAFVLCSQGRIEPHHFPPDVLQQQSDVSQPFEGNMNLKKMERSIIQAALQKHRGNRALAAKELGVNPSTLFRKLQKQNINIPNTDGRGRR